MFGDLDQPLSASCGFVSISWASCITAWRRYVYRVSATATWL